MIFWNAHSARRAGWVLCERKKRIDRNHELPMTRQAEVLGISRGAVYYVARPMSEADVLHQTISTARCAGLVDKATSRLNPPSLHLIIGVCCSDERGYFSGHEERRRYFWQVGFQNREVCLNKSRSTHKKGLLRVGYARSFYWAIRICSITEVLNPQPHKSRRLAQSPPA